jgi:ribulose-5-phosphate 4-epimerase/fuculose-1-phosphate aldolase
VKVSDLILLNHDGEPVGGNTSRPPNAADFQIHVVLHRRRSHINAACHAQSIYDKAWTTFAKQLDMANQDVTIFYREAQAVNPEFGGVFLKKEVSERLGGFLGAKGKAVDCETMGY